jgi:hypothetical protein
MVRGNYYWHTQMKQAEKQRDEALRLLALVMCDAENQGARRQAREMVKDYLPTAINFDQNAFDKFAPIIGADPEWFGKVLRFPTKINGREFTACYTIVGACPDTKKVLLTTQRGKVKHMTVARVAKVMGVAEPKKPGTRALQV